jgi:hypothetical protein
MVHNNDNLLGTGVLGFGAGLYFFFKGFREVRKRWVGTQSRLRV